MIANVPEPPNIQEEDDDEEELVENQLSAAELEEKLQKAKAKIVSESAKAEENKVVKLLEKNPLGMTLPEMAGGIRKQKRIKQLRPVLAEAIKKGIVMPVSQRSGHTVYKLVRNMGSR